MTQNKHFQKYLPENDGSCTDAMPLNERSIFRMFLSFSGKGLCFPASLKKVLAFSPLYTLTPPFSSRFTVTTARRLNEDSARGRRNRRWPRCREMRPDHAGRDGVKDEANEMAAQKLAGEKRGLMEDTWLGKVNQPSSTRQ